MSVSAEGVTGHGECVADDRSLLPAGDPRHRPPRAEGLPGAARLLRGDFAHPRDLAAAFAPVRGHEMAKAALEMAVLGAPGARREGVPLYRVLGGRGGEHRGRRVDRAAEGRARRSWSAWRPRSAAGLPPRSRSRSSRGGTRRWWRRCAARFPDLPLMVDANSAYTLDDAPLFEALDALRADDDRAAARLGRHRGPRGAAAPHPDPDLPRRVDPLRRDARHALDLGACRVINLKAGPRRRLRARASPSTTSAESAACPLWCGGMLESGIGRLANVHLQTLPGFTLPGDTSASARYFAEDLVDPPVTVSKDGLDRGARAAGHRPRDRVASASSGPRSCREEWRRP